MLHKEKGRCKFSGIEYTSTPRRNEGCSAGVSTDLMQDTGYATSSSITFSPVSATEIDVFPDSFDEERCFGARKSLRGKRRVDILSALMSYERSGYVLRKVLRYLKVCDRLPMLSVCKSWHSLKWRFPEMFTIKKHECTEENRVKHLPKSTLGRKPLSVVNYCGASLPADRSCNYQSKEFLHACPVCSGVAFYRPSEWPNRLHCQAVDCGVSVCFDCRREHSPSEKCSVKASSPVRRLSPIHPRSSPVRSPRTRWRLMKASLRRL
uniref:F-box domain-containing protein n=1 Tax=Trichobilharzia regenti TaxID=157069 RepID=A0AA85J5M3_TRIRE|nr:unnamed protein product [Trichobilharzia regenti]